MAVNARGVFLGMKYEIPEIAKAGGGAILNVASAAGVVGPDISLPMPRPSMPSSG